MELKVRLAQPSDAQRIWEIRNSPESLAVAASQEIIPLEQHINWFNSKYFGNKNNFCFAAEADGKDFEFKHCVEMRGHITWHSFGSDSVSEKRLFHYVLFVDPVEEVGLIPEGFLSDGPPVPSAEEATKLCTPEK